jgi:hypothetical protein
MPVRPTSTRPLVVVAAASGLYDLLLGIAMLAGRGLLQSAFALPSPIPPIHADLNGLFLVAVGIGYRWPYRDPDRYRGYLWIMGPLLKGGGSLLFVADHIFRGSPDAFLLFALTDGTLALWTLWALRRAPARQHD